MKSLSRAQLLATPWTGAYEAAPSMGFSRQEYWGGVPLPSPVPDSIKVLDPYLDRGRGGAAKRAVTKATELKRYRV